MQRVLADCGDQRSYPSAKKLESESELQIINSIIPRCLLGQHPRLRWNRRRRNVALSKAQKVHKLKEYLKKLAFNDMHGIENNYEDMDEYRLDPQDFLIETPERQKRNTRDMEEAYEKYYQKIQAKYRDFVTTLLGARKDNGRVEDTHRNYLDQLRTSSRLEQQHPSDLDNRHLLTANQQNSPLDDAYSRLYPASLEEPAQPIFSPISIPDITDRLDDSLRWQSRQNFGNHRETLPPVNYEEKQKQQKEHHKEPDIEELIAQLKSQTVRRRKREARRWTFDSIQLYQNDEALDAFNASKKNRAPKVPCEVRQLTS